METRCWWGARPHALVVFPFLCVASHLRNCVSCNTNILELKKQSSLNIHLRATGVKIVFLQCSRTAFDSETTAGVRVRTQRFTVPCIPNLSGSFSSCNLVSFVTFFKAICASLQNSKVAVLVIVSIYFSVRSCGWGLWLQLPAGAGTESAVHRAAPASAQQHSSG